VTTLTLAASQGDVDRLVCKLPAGQGPHEKVVVNVASLVSEPASLGSDELRYNPPAVSSIWPRHAPTSGRAVPT